MYFIKVLVKHKIRVDSALCNVATFLNDGRFVCGLSNCEIQVLFMELTNCQVFDLNQKKTIASLTGHSSSLLSLFSFPDSNLFASFDVSGILNVYSFFVHNIDMGSTQYFSFAPAASSKLTGDLAFWLLFCYHLRKQ